MGYYFRREKRKHGDVGIVGKENWRGVKHGEGNEDRKWGRRGRAGTCVRDGLSCGFFRSSDVIKSAAFADTEGGIE
jgi:hypothetical protein